jgi:hypothetical protein
MPIIVATDFNGNVKDNCNAKLVKFMRDTLELDILLNISEGTTRSNSCTDMVFGQNMDMNYVSYFSYHRPILSTIILWHDYKLNALGNWNK